MSLRLSCDFSGQGEALKASEKYERLVPYFILLVMESAIMLAYVATSRRRCSGTSRSGLVQVLLEDMEWIRYAGRSFMNEFTGPDGDASLSVLASLLEQSTHKLDTA